MTTTFCKGVVQDTVSIEVCMQAPSRQVELAHSATTEQVQCLNPLAQMRHKDVWQVLLLDMRNDSGTPAASAGSSRQSTYSRHERVLGFQANHGPAVRLATPVCKYSMGRA
jgi:hypothetical protein